MKHFDLNYQQLCSYSKEKESSTVFVHQYHYQKTAKSAFSLKCLRVWSFFFFYLYESATKFIPHMARSRFPGCRYPHVLACFLFLMHSLTPTSMSSWVLLPLSCLLARIRGEPQLCFGILRSHKRHSSQCRLSASIFLRHIQYIDVSQPLTATLH